MIGGGPGGLIAAEVLATAGLAVCVYERMPSVGRKLLVAGRGGLNLTYIEPFDAFLARYGSAAARLTAALEAFGPDDLRAWCAGLGQTTFIGSSGRVFPAAFRATPLLRAWLARLDGLGVQRRVRHTWRGWRNDGALIFECPDGELSVTPDLTILALGGATWPRTGSDGAWVPTLRSAGVAVAPLRPANCGFVVAWSPHFVDRFAGASLKNVRLAHGAASVRGDTTITTHGIEGGATHMLSASLRDAIEADGSANLNVDLHPDLTVAALAERLARRRTSDSKSTVLKRAGGLQPVAVGLLREATQNRLPDDPADLARAVKNVRLALVAAQPLARAISTAGGVNLDEVDASFMLRRRPGTFVVGEMLDWEAPTGGYLLQATFSTAVCAARAAAAWLDQASVASGYQSGMSRRAGTIAPRMKSTLEAVEDNKVKLSVEVDVAEFEVALARAFRRIASEVRIPGFRPGKVPRKVLEARVGGAAARQEALREAIPGYYVEALRENEVDAIAQPEIAITGGENIGPVTFEATVEVRPIIAIEGYGGLSVVVPRMEVTDDDVERALRRLRSAEAALVDVERPAISGDVLTIDLKATRQRDETEEVLDDVQDYSYEIGDAAGFPPEIDEQLVGTVVDQDLIVMATVGEGDHASEITFTMKVKKIQEKDLPPLTDEWVKDTTDEYATVEALRADLVKGLTQGRKEAAAAAIRQRTLPELVKLVADEVVPEPLIAEEVQRQATELERNLRRQNVDLGEYLSAMGGGDAVIAHLRVQAIPSVKADLALRAIAEAEGITVSEQDLDEAVVKMAAEYGQTPAQLRQAFAQNSGMQAVRSDLRKGKALDWVVAHVEVKDTEGIPVDQDALRASELEIDADTEEQE